MSTSSNQIDQHNITSVSEVKGLNFNDGLAHYVATVVMTETDRQSARATAYKRKEEGAGLRERIQNINQKMTAGKLVSQCRSHHLGVHVLEQAETRENERITKVDDKFKRDEFLYIKACTKADAAIQANTHQSDNVAKWTRTHILDLIRPLKIEGDKAMPPNKPELYQRYLQTKHRERRSVDADIHKQYEESLLVMDDLDVEDNDEVSVESDVKEFSANELAGTAL